LWQIAIWIPQGFPKGHLWSPQRRWRASFATVQSTSESAAGPASASNTWVFSSNATWHSYGHMAGRNTTQAIFRMERLAVL